MQNSLWIRLITALFLGLASVSAQAGAAIGLRSSTLGLYGMEATVGLSDRFSVRVPYNTLTITYDGLNDGVDYKGKLKLQTYGGQLDFFPWKGSFYLTAGVYANHNRLKLRAFDDSGEKQYKLGDQDRVFTSDPNDPLTLRGRVKFKSSAPFLGLGWGNAVAEESYFRFELGALFQGGSKLDLQSSGTAIDQETQTPIDTSSDSVPAQMFRELLAEERESTRHDIDQAIKIYPSISFVFGMRFGQSKPTKDAEGASSGN